MLFTVDPPLIVPSTPVTTPADTVTVAPLSTVNWIKSEVDDEENAVVELKVADVLLLKIPVSDIVVVPAPDVVKVAI